MWSLHTQVRNWWDLLECTFLLKALCLSSAYKIFYIQESILILSEFMHYDSKSLSLVLTEVVLHRRIIGDEAAIAPDVPEMLLWWWPSAIRQLSSTDSLVIITHYLGPSLFTRLASRHLSAVFKIGALPSREMFRAFSPGSSCSQKGLSSAVWCTGNSVGYGLAGAFQQAASNSTPTWLDAFLAI